MEGIEYLSRGGQMMLQSLVKDKDKSTGRGNGPQDILFSVLKEDEKKRNRLELLDYGESGENEDLYQPYNLSDETDCDENIDNDHIMFPMWDPHDIALTNPSNVEENNIEGNANISIDDRRMNYSNEEDIDFQHADPSKEPVEQIDFNEVPGNSMTKIRGNYSSKNRPKLLKLMKSPCNCKQNCLAKIPEERRVNIL